MKISEIITDKYKLRIPPTVYYELLADVRNEQEPKSYQWCTDCKEYDQEKHCCHRWSKVIRGTVEEIKQEQEPIKALGEELRKVREGIKDEKVLVGYNMAVAICNKHLGGSEVEDGKID